MGYNMKKKSLFFVFVATSLLFAQTEGPDIDLIV